jgi:hypothetical protein
VRAASSVGTTMARAFGGAGGWPGFGSSFLPTRRPPITKIATMAPMIQARVRLGEPTRSSGSATSLRSATAGSAQPPLLELLLLDDADT